MNRYLGGSAEASTARRRRSWAVLTVIELGVVTAAVIGDFLLPTFVILVTASVSLGIRRERFATLGYVKPAHPRRMAWQVLGLVMLWTLLQVGVFMPVLEHLTGEQQDVTSFEDVEGDLGVLLAFLALSWTLAAVGEETAYRGFVHTRVADLVGRHRAGAAVAVGTSALLFGLAHTEQGTIGVVVTLLDGLALGYLRLRYRTLWAPILAHGFNNTIGLTAFYFVGPIHGLW